MNDDPGKMLDLEPHKWRSDREKPREPFFGPGWPNAVVYVLTAVILFGLSWGLREIGRKVEPQSLPPGAYTWTPDKGLAAR